MSIVTVVVTPKFTVLMAPSNQIAAVIFCGEKRCADYVLTRMKYLLMLTVLAAAICFSVLPPISCSRSAPQAIAPLPRAIPFQEKKPATKAVSSRGLARVQTRA